MTTYGQFLRAERIAGGRGATDRQFIRACHGLIHPLFRRDRDVRERRHAWLREMLAMRDQNEALLRSVRL